MARANYRFKRSPPKLSVDHARMNRTSAPPQATQAELGAVGYVDDQGTPESTPLFVRLEQGEPVVEVTTRDGDRITARIDTGMAYAALTFGTQVLLCYPDGQPELATITAVLADNVRPLPSSVAGISTGAASATTKGTFIAAPMWHFIRPPDGGLLAIETAGADVIIHTDQVVEIAGSSILLNGRVALGEGPTVAPIGATAGPGGTTIPGSPAIPPIPVPYIPVPGIPLPVPYVGLAAGIVRAQEMFQSNIFVDPVTFAWMLGVDEFIRAIVPALPPAPVAITSAISGVSGPGSQHTASD